MKSFGLLCIFFGRKDRFFQALAETLPITDIETARLHSKMKELVRVVKTRC